VDELAALIDADDFFAAFRGNRARARELALESTLLAEPVREIAFGGFLGLATDADPGALVESARERSRWPRRDVEDDGGRSLVQEPLDKLSERVGILKGRARSEAGGPEELRVALHAPIYPPRPHFLTLAPASDLHSGHPSPLSVR
jgi:hypothetical protein